MYRDYRPKGVKFFFIYKALAHPELRGSHVQPFTMDERLNHVRQAMKQLGATVPWLVDPMDNRLKHALGDRPHSEFIIDPKGKVVRKLARSNPTKVREYLEELVGKVEKITKPEDLKLKSGAPLAQPAPTGVVARVRRAGMFALVAQPKIDKDGPPFYAKLRAEANISLLDEGKGKLYLGFHLDPIYQAHWNNLNKPLRFQLEVPDGVQLSKESAEAAAVKVPSDSDPREFLLDVEAWPADKTVRLTVTYSACTGEDCHVVQQVYVLRRQRDRDGGKAAGTGFRALKPEELIQQLMQGDKNGDGKLTKEESSSVLRPRFDEFDRNQDGLLDGDEIGKMARFLTKPWKP